MREKGKDKKNFIYTDTKLAEIFPITEKKIGNYFIVPKNSQNTQNII